jgi:hypothetical protein
MHDDLLLDDPEGCNMVFISKKKEERDQRVTGGV